MTLSEYKIIDKVLGVPLKDKEGREFVMGSYKTLHNDVSAEHGLIYKGNIVNPKKPILFRINSACYTSDIFGCQRCDCHWQLTEAMNMIYEKGGLIIYHFHHEGRGFGFTSKLKSLKSMSPIDAIMKLHNELDYRRYKSTVKILNDLGIHKVRLITNNPLKRKILEEQNIEVVEQIPLITKDEHLRDYLNIKKERLNNIINFDE
jgi:3,4-dihydroxy 2-butanone 4-phosphate synthase/GTP cyclohydrolase II